MPFVQVNPRYRELLDALELRAPDQFLALPAVVVSGHPERHVARTVLGSLPAYLKREHRVRWRDRIASWFAGYGFVTKSQREAMTLRALEQAGIGCPDWIAFGEDGQGRAFLLVRALENAVELRRFLHGGCEENPQVRREVARQIGIALARMHDAGFDHPDLYSKHVLVGDDRSSIYFLDWQRSRRGPVDERRRVRDLAALDATLAEELASDSDRWACLRAYQEHRASLPDDSPTASLGPRMKSFARGVRRRSQQLLGYRHVSESRRPAPAEAQELIWLDGEALCITPRFLEELRGKVPDWLGPDKSSGAHDETALSFVALPGGRRGLLVRSRRNQPLRWLWAEFRRKPLATPEVRRAGVLFRRQRRGQSAPRLLAFGQRSSLPWRTESFLLTEVPVVADGRAP
jgi:tRNA A-37 threonylcarbamoyl transferase component Bud32